VACEYYEIRFSYKNKPLGGQIILEKNLEMMKYIVNFLLTIYRNGPINIQIKKKEQKTDNRELLQSTTLVEA